MGQQEVIKKMNSFAFWTNVFYTIIMAGCSYVMFDLKHTKLSFLYAVGSGFGLALSVMHLIYG